jgi:hypothetical protein
VSGVTRAHISTLPARFFSLALFASAGGQRVFLLERAGMDRPHTSEATMKKLTPAIAALLLAACGPAKQDPAQPYRDALPKAEAAHVGTYQDAGATAGALSVARQGLGDSNLVQSEYAVQSYYLALSINGGASAILNVIRFITAFPTTSCDDTSCTWGPWVGDQGFNNYKLVVTKQTTVDGTAYAYAFSGQNAVVAGSPFVDILTGTAYPVDRDRGRGRFTLDFDAQDALAHPQDYVKKDYGQLRLDYDNTQDAIVAAQFVGAHEQDGDADPANDRLITAAYRFEAASSGGVLQVAVENLTSGDTLALRTRWGASGQGRADVVFTPLGQTSFTASECWLGRSQDWAETYDTKHLDIPQLQDASSCAPFASFQAADISPPQ